MSLSAAVDGSSTPPWPLVAALADQVVFFVGFYGSHRDKPAGPELGYHPALLIGACGGAFTTFGLLTGFAAMDLI